MSANQQRMATRLAAPFAITLAGIGAVLPGQTVSHRQQIITARKAGAAPRSVQLTYIFKPGDTRRYQVRAYFDGHFPPFAQPGSPPVHLLAKLEYVAKALKQDAQGTQVAFTVDAADLSLLKDEVPVGAKINPDDVVPFPIELADVQKTLNTTAVLRRDGSIVNLVNAGPNIVRVNVGIDLRQMFLLVMPVIFPKAAVHAGEKWTSDTGVLGSKPGSILYTNQLKSLAAGGQKLVLQIDQTGTSKIVDQLDKDGNSTSKPADVVSTLSGDVTLRGDMKYAAAPLPGQAAGASANLRGAQLSAGLFTMQANLVRKVTRNDVAPEIKQATDATIDVKARMLVQAEDNPVGG